MEAKKVGSFNRVRWRTVAQRYRLIIIWILQLRHIFYLSKSSVVLY